VRLRQGAWALALAGCAGGEVPVAAKELTVRDAYAFEAKAGGVAAAYAVIVNGRDSADVLDSITSTAAGSTTAHASVEADGLVTMTPLERPSIPAHDSLVLQPGGNHLMLEGVVRTLVPGDTLTITYWFRLGGPRPTLTTVRPYGS
jgi:copper(I)-binding protein